MSINIHIEKKDLWLLAAIMVFLVGVGYVIAYRSGASPSVMGHSAEELEGVQAKIVQGMTACAGANQAIKTINPDTGVVTCETDDVGSGGDLQTMRNMVLFLKVPIDFSWSTDTASGNWQQVHESTKTLLPQGKYLKMHGETWGEGGGTMKFSVNVGGTWHDSSELRCLKDNANCWVSLDSSSIPFDSTPKEYTFRIWFKGDWYKEDVGLAVQQEHSGTYPPLYWTD